MKQRRNLRRGQGKKLVASVGWEWEWDKHSWAGSGVWDKVVIGWHVPPGQGEAWISPLMKPCHGHSLELRNRATHYLDVGWHLAIISQKTLVFSYTVRCSLSSLTLKTKMGKSILPHFYPTLYIDFMNLIPSRYSDLLLGNHFIANFLFCAVLLKSTQQNT